MIFYSLTIFCRHFNCLSHVFIMSMFMYTDLVPPSGGSINHIIKEDLPVEVKNQGADLRPIVSHAKHLNIEARIKGDTLTVDNNRYRHEDLDLLHTHLQLLAARSPQVVDNVVRFYSRYPPPSNFSPCQLSIYKRTGLHVCRTVLSVPQGSTLKKWTSSKNEWVSEWVSEWFNAVSATEAIFTVRTC